MAEETGLYGLIPVAVGAGLALLTLEAVKDITAPKEYSTSPLIKFETTDWKGMKSIQDVV
jgi:hypothetical protein